MESYHYGFLQTWNESFEVINVKCNLKDNGTRDEITRTVLAEPVLVRSVSFSVAANLRFRIRWETEIKSSSDNRICWKPDLVALDIGSWTVLTLLKVARPLVADTARQSINYKDWLIVYWFT